MLTRPVPRRSGVLPIDRVDRSAREPGFGSGTSHIRLRAGSGRARCGRSGRVERAAAVADAAAQFVAKPDFQIDPARSVMVAVARDVRQHLGKNDVHILDPVGGVASARRKVDPLQAVRAHLQASLASSGQTGWRCDVASSSVWKRSSSCALSAPCRRDMSHAVPGSPRGGQGLCVGRLVVDAKTVSMRVRRNTFRTPGDSAAISSGRSGRAVSWPPRWRPRPLLSMNSTLLRSRMTGRARMGRCVRIASLNRMATAASSRVSRNSITSAPPASPSVICMIMSFLACPYKPSAKVLPRACQLAAARARATQAASFANFLVTGELHDTSMDPRGKRPQEERVGYHTRWRGGLRARGFASRSRTARNAPSRLPPSGRGCRAAAGRLADAPGGCDHFRAERNCRRTAPPCAIGTSCSAMPTRGNLPGKGLLRRFRKGGGALYDLEYLTDEAGRRVAPSAIGPGLPGRRCRFWPMPRRRAAASARRLRALPTRMRDGRCCGAGACTGLDLPRVLVIGALGRWGAVPRTCARQWACPVTAWDKAETATGGPFPEVLAHDVFLNCILAMPGTPVFVPAGGHGPARVAGDRRYRL